MSERVLLIDDDQRLAEMVGRYLTRYGMVVEHRPDARSGREALAASVPDLLLLDLMLPDADGLDVCRDVRRMPGPASTVPILMLTARGETTDRVVGLEIGADDYLAKPFEPRELLARARALLRRSRFAAVAGAAPPTAGNGATGVGATSDPPAEAIRLGRLEIDLDARRVRVRGEDRSLTAYQFDLLVALARHAGKVMSRDRLMDLVKGAPLEAFDRSIDVHVGKIRQAIEDDPKSPRRILTVRGAGYVMAREQDRDGPV
ncbi:MAG: response regulator [Lautropia sp.]